MEDDIVFQILSQKEEKLNEKEETQNKNELLEEKIEKDEINIEKDDNLILTNDKPEKKKKEEKYFIPNIQNPIDFVNYIEVEKSNTKITQAYSNFTIKNHKKETKLKSVLEVEPHLDIIKKYFFER